MTWKPDWLKGKGDAIPRRNPLARDLAEVVRPDDYPDDYRGRRRSSDDPGDVEAAQSRLRRTGPVGEELQVVSVEGVERRESDSTRPQGPETPSDIPTAVPLPWTVDLAAYPPSAIRAINAGRDWTDVGLIAEGVALEKLIASKPCVIPWEVQTAEMIAINDRVYRRSPSTAAPKSPKRQKHSRESVFK